MIERVIDEVIRRLPPSDGDNLLGFQIDADHFLGECDALASVEVERSSDIRSLLNASAILADHVSSLHDISQALFAVWQSLYYPHFHASAIHWYREATILRFLTVISDDGYFVTGTVTVSGEQYPRLVEKFEREFGGLRGPLPRLRE
jgi:hypothetical protein